MKFSSSLKFNAVADWWDDYIAYDTLKRCIYQLEKQLYSRPRSSAHRDDLDASEPLLHQPSEADTLFVPFLDRELSKICGFYRTQELEMFQEYEDIDQSVQELDERGFHGYRRYYDDEDDEDDDESVSLRTTSPVGRRRTRSEAASNIPVNLHPSRDDIGPSTSGPYSQPSSPTNSPTVPRPHFRIPSPPSHSNQIYPRSQSHTFPRSRTRSRSVGGRSAIDKFTSTLQSLRDTFTPGAPSHDDESQAESAALSDVVGGGGETVWNSYSNYAYDTRLLFKRRMTKLYISLTNLRAYTELNYTGFRKILKKYDKVIHSTLSPSYLAKIQGSYPFKDETKANLEETINRLIQLYSKCVTNEDVAQAGTQLKAHQREQIAWERDTVWRLMIGRERRGEATAIGIRGRRASDTLESGGEEIVNESAGGTLVRVREPEPGLFQIPLPVLIAGRREKDGAKRAITVTKKRVWISLAFVSLFGLLNWKVIHVKGGNAAANDCFAVLVFCTILWASEAIPLFVTSLAVPLLLVVLRVICTDGKRLSTQDATKFVFSVIFSPTIMLLIGGFTISSALSKTNIDRLIITRVLSMAGTKPARVLLAFMGVSCFASMWISNVAAPTLCFTLIRPILRTLPPKSSFAPCLILAIALAANIGGQSSPISSPQNLIALQAMVPELDWARWFAVSLPVSAVSIILIWLLLLVSYRPSRLPPTVEGDILDEGDWTGSYRELEIKPIRPTREKFTAKQYWIDDYLGDMGIIAIMPILAFFGTGVLKKDDFERFAWSIVFLAMGGIALGQGVVSSGLLEVMDVLIRDMLDRFSLYTVVLVLSPVVLVVSTFISHTIASVLLVPIAKEVGTNLAGGHSNLLIFITALICSAGMGLPVSGFPNQTAAAQEDELGEPYLTNLDFLKNGVPASIIATLVVVTIGFVIMKLVGL